MQSNETLEKTEIHSKKNVAFGAVIGVLSLFLSICSGLVFTSKFNQLFTKEYYGLYSTAYSLINLFLINFGLATTASTYFSKYRAQQRNEEIKTLFGFLYKVYGIIDFFVLVVCVAIYFSIDYVNVGLTGPERVELKNLFAIATVFSVLSFPFNPLDGVLNAYEKYIFLKLVGVLSQVITFVISLLTLYFGWSLDLYMILTSSVLLFTVLFKLCYVSFRLKVLPSFATKMPHEQIRKILSFSGWGAVIDVCYRLFTFITPTILSIISNSSEIAIFHIVTILETYSYTFSTLISSFFFAKVSRIFEEQDSEEKFLNFSIKVGKFQFVLMSLLFVGFASCGQEFLLLWLKDPSFASAYYGVLIILLFEMLYSPTSALVTAIYEKDKIKNLAFVYLISSFLFIALTFLLGRFYGSTGASIAIFVSKLLEIFGIFYILHSFPFRVCFFLRNVYVKPLLSILITLSVGLLLHYFLPLTGLGKFFLIVASVILVYFFTTYFLAFSREEKQYYFSLFRMLFHRKDKRDVISK